MSEKPSKKQRAQLERRITYVGVRAGQLIHKPTNGTKDNERRRENESQLIKKALRLEKKRTFHKSIVN